jgi:hypothetical protein
MSNLVTVQNLSSRPKSIVYQGKQITIGPSTNETYQKEVADRFLSTHVGTVVNVEAGLSQDVGDVTGVDTMWVANITGDPDAPDMVTGEPYMNKQGEKVIPQFPNPRKNAMVVKRPYDLGQQPYIEKDGSESALNLAKIMVVIPPLGRRQLSKDIGEWMLNRDRITDPGARGRLMKSRAPSSFEPDMTWPLDEMRIYIKLCDASKEVGASEATITAEGGDVDAAKRTLWPRLFMLLVNPEVRLPTRQEFNEYMRGEGQALIQKAA